MPWLKCIKYLAVVGIREDSIKLLNRKRHLSWCFFVDPMYEIKRTK